MNRLVTLFICILVLFASTDRAAACTSAVVPGVSTLSGRTILWKHRDTGASSNFIDKVEATDSTMAFIGLFNGGDSRRAEVWVGMNTAGFAVMNTAVYNLTPNSPGCRDREGVVMRRALEVCRTVEDFDSLLRSLPQPRGIHATFGVTDAEGNTAYFETDDRRTFFYPMGEKAWDIRTNFALAGSTAQRKGVERYRTAKGIITEKRRYTPDFFLRGLSRCFFDSTKGLDLLKEQTLTTPDDGRLIPRRSSTASVVIEGPDGPGDMPRMFVALGFPPTAEIFEVTFDDIPADVRPDSSGFAPAWRRADALSRDLFFTKEGRRYFNLVNLRRLLSEEK